MDQKDLKLHFQRFLTHLASRLNDVGISPKEKEVITRLMTAQNRIAECQKPEPFSRNAHGLSP